MDRQTLSALQLRLTEAARAGAKEYCTEYLRSFREILQINQTSKGFSGTLYCHDVHDLRQAIKIGLLCNKRTYADVIDRTGLMQIITLGEKSPLLDNEHLNIVIPNNMISQMQHAIDTDGFMAGFVMPINDESDKLLSDAANAIRSGSLFLRPQRVLMYDTGEQTAEGGRNWNVVEALSDSPSDAWAVSSEQSAQQTAIATDAAFRSGLGSPEGQIKCEIVLPYIEHVPLDDYVRIMGDEEDILTEFRAALNKLAKDAADLGSKVEQFAGDVVSPRVAAIDRKFRRTIASTRFKSTGAAVAAASLSLVSYLTAGSASAVAALAGGAGAIGAVKELVDGIERRRAIKDDPLYLLWRLQRGGSSSQR